MMAKEQQYTTQLQAGLGVYNETRLLLDLWQPGMKSSELFQSVLSSGQFANVSARRLQNIIKECFVPRYLISGDYPAIVLKDLINILPTSSILQLFFIYTARANRILYDFVQEVYWKRYSSGFDHINNDDAKNFVVLANQQGKTTTLWSESTIRRVSAYLTGCCADFGLLEKGRKSDRKILPFIIKPEVAAILAYDLHLAGVGDNSVIVNDDWKLFGLDKHDVLDIFKQLALKDFFIVQTAGDVTRIGWKYSDWREVKHAITQ